MRGREASRCKRNINRLPLTRPHQGTWSTTQACALTWDRTGDLSVCRMTPKSLSHTSQGYCLSFDMYCKLVFKKKMCQFILLAVV